MTKFVISQEWLDHFAELRAAVAALDAESKASLGAGYSVTFRGAAHQKLGRVRIPERAGNPEAAGQLLQIIHVYWSLSIGTDPNLSHAAG
ncbi:MAG: hypothetical protein ACLQO1_02950 [Steroidobacteraceae bacterium]